MVVDVCDYFDTDLPAAPLPHFGLCEQAVQVLLTHGNHLAALEASGLREGACSTCLSARDFNRDWSTRL